MRIGLISALTLSALLINPERSLALAPPQPPTDNSAAIGSSAGDPEPSSDRSVDSVDMARELWKQGVNAFQKKEYKTARIAFEKCYAFMPKTEVLRNLSISEVESGAYVSAAGHLKELLVPDAKLSQQVRDRLQALLTRSLAQIGQLAITVDVAGSEIWVDNKNVGKAPLGGVWYVTPGRHTVRIERTRGPDSTRRVYAMAGVAIPVEFEASVAPPPTVVQLARPSAFTQSSPPISDISDGLTTRAAAVVAVGGSLAALALASATYFTTRSYRHAASAEAISQRLQNALPAGTGVCSSQTLFTSDCAELRKDRRREVSNSNRARLSFIGFGVAGTATLGYALYLAFGGKDSPPSQIVPLVDVRSTGTTWSLRGQF